MALSTSEFPLFGSGSAVATLFDVSVGRYRPITDRRAAFRATGAKTVPPIEFHNGFVSRRKDMLSAMEGLSAEYRGRSAAHFEDVQSEYAVSGAPVPGGVGYGVFYNEPFRKAFRTGTVVAFDIIAPERAGGNVNTWLYLTGMNRAALGVEAFLSYYQGEQFRFRVFDWSRPDHWQTDKPFDEMSEYLGRRVYDGTEYNVVSIQNQTLQIAPGQWQNNVWLVNYSTGDYDLVYSHSYPATESDQKAAFTGSWGPIVETFQDMYSGTNALGFLYTYMQSCDESFNWGPWGLVSPLESTIPGIGNGFKLLFLDPNHSFAVAG